MRKFHRWFGLITGVFFAFIALTGIGMQVIRLVSPERERPPASQKVISPTAPGSSPARAPQEGGRKPDLYHWLDHIHDGEIAGTSGRILSLLLGLALFFFSVSGIWMYWKMFDARSRLGKKNIFW